MPDRKPRTTRNRKRRSASPEAAPQQNAPRQDAPEASASPSASASGGGRVRAIRREEMPEPRAEAERPRAPQRADLLARDALQDLASMDEAAFAAAFGQAVSGISRREALEPGTKVTGRVIRIGSADLFIGVGGKSEATIERGEFTDASGELTVGLGDEITALVLSVRGGEIRLSRRLRGQALREHIQDAIDSKIPVDGRVVERNTGGFVVELGEIRAFCPVSQIDRFPGEDLDRFIGETLSFRIQEYSGGDAVVSHRAIQEEKLEAIRETLWQELAEGDLREGVIRSVQPYGAFVDIGGLEGLVHKSELSWGDNVDPTQIVSSGDRVQVRVLEVDRGRQRISLSMRDPSANPWTRVGSDFRVGATYSGTVVRMTDFGAFVDLAPGLTGLLHREQIADEAPARVEDALQRGQQVQVRILSADVERRRISLTMKDGGGYDRAAAEPASTLGTFADLFKGLKIK